MTSDQRPAPDLPPVVERFVAAVTRAIVAVYDFRRKIATVAVLALAGLVAYHAVFGANGMLVYQKKRSDYKALQKEVDHLQQNNQQLSDQIKALRTDRSAIEKEAREQLHYAKPGEVIYLMPAPRRAEAPPANATAEKR